MRVGEIIERLQRERKIGPSPRRGRLIVGRLKAHGRANYQFESQGSPSYYAQILTSRGVETLWGVDLERAIVQSKSQLKSGSMVGVRRVGSELVTLPAREGDAATVQRTFRRAQWVVEDITFFAESIRRARRDRETQLTDAAAMRARPELRSAFVSLHIAEQFAERNIRDPRDRALFVERVKAVMALSVKTLAHVPASSSTKTPRREDPTR